MDKQTIKNSLIESHNAFTTYINSLNDDAFLSSNNGKWTPGQQLEHIHISVRVVRQGLSLPKFFLKLFFGKANRVGRDYDGLVKKYKSKLEQGGRAPKRFIPKEVNIKRGQKLHIALKKEVTNLCSKTDKFTEQELDSFIMPHPLLGKITIRELLYFTIYHVKLHEILTKRDLE